MFLQRSKMTTTVVLTMTALLWQLQEQALHVFGFVPVTPGVKHRPMMTTTSSSSSSSFSSLNMFTGIVEEMGTVVSLEQRDDMTLWDGSTGRGTELTVQCQSDTVILQGAYVGCSISVSGVCLTATTLKLDQHQFTVGLAPETLDKTYFGQQPPVPGSLVNLERASEIGGRNSGHFVQGHVDCTGTILEKRPDQDSLWITVKVNDPSVMPYIVPKGFIAIDGTSLTVVDVDRTNHTFTFMLIEYTQKKIIVPQKNINDLVNLEVDVLAKYSETALAPIVPRVEQLEAQIHALEQKVAKLQLLVEQQQQ